MIKHLFFFSSLLLFSMFGFSQSYPSISCTSNKNYCIARVNMEGIYQDADTGPSSYTDYTDGLDYIDKALVIRGETYTLNIRVLKDKKYKYTSVWIDWNDDGDFTDSGENIFASGNVKTQDFAISVTIPSNAAKGKIRMRIVTLKDSSPTSSGSQGDKGEAEDYALSVGDISDFLYYTSDAEDARYKIDRNTGFSMWLSDNNVSNIEAMAIWPVQNYTYYYAADGGDFGTLGLESGNFSIIADIDANGQAQGADGGISLDDVDGMGFDARTGILWASHRRGVDYDILFQINPTTGHFVEDAFGNGIDYLVIDGSGVYQYFDDIAVSPINGKIYGVSNNGSSHQLLEINPQTGSINVNTAITGAIDLEGLTFSNDGVLYATSGTDDEMYTLNTSTGAATFVGEAWLWGGDVEAIIALTDEANKITGNLWKDNDNDGIEDAGETSGISGVTIELWYDNNNNNEVDGGDELLQSTETDANGDYSFDYATTGNLAIRVKVSTLPSGYALTTDNKESADFTTLGNTDNNNNFGANDGSDCDGDGIPDFAEGNGDSDGDGINDKCDKDSDNDGILDIDEGTKDTDGDGIKDYLDLDSDNDGIPDAIEANGGSAPSSYNNTGRIGGNVDSDGLPTAVYTAGVSNLENFDSDGDGIKDYLDLDSDNDGILDIVEAGGTDSDGNGRVDSFSDSNNDGYHDSYASSALPIPNTDSATEAVNLPNYRDIDSDGDSIDDTHEGYSPADYSVITVIKDNDGDGILNHYDNDSGGESITPFDYDGDGAPDYMDQDSDDDGGSDYIEGNDANGDGVRDSSPSGIDANNNGLDDTFDKYCEGTGTNYTATSKAEEDNSDGSVNTSSSDIELTYDSEQQTVGIRFTNVTIEQGASISSASIQFEVDETSSGSLTLTIRGEDADNSAAFSTADYDVSSRTMTSASISWSPGDWTTVGDNGSAQKTTNIKTIIQEIVNRASWTSGNALTIIITGSGTNTRIAENDPVLSIFTTDALKYDCGSEIALNDNNGNGKFDFRDGSIQLPIELIEFKAKLIDKKTQINWTTASEKNNEYFMVQRSANGVDFEDLEKVQGAGNSNTILKYQIYDYMPFDGINYYRLMQVDYDGTTSFSSIVAVRNDTNKIVQIFPNPSSGIFTINSLDDLELDIYTMNAQLIYSNKVEANSSKKIDLSDLPKGIYILVYRSNNTTKTRRIIIK